MPYPQIVDYNEAVQNPRTAFRDLVLQGGRIRENNLGLPLALSGGFALTYNLTTSNGKRLAIRCFHRQIPEAEVRYSQISQCLKSINSSYFVDFAFQPQGIRVKQSYYPIVSMEWVDGDTLGQFLERHLRDTSTIVRLRDSFRQLSSYLDGCGIAHGDIQNGNVILPNGNLRLVDYDGMYVPGLPQSQGTELGHKHFQHPKRNEKHFGPAMDRFSFICVDLSLQAIMADPSLHDRFKEGGETIIFKANDFASPGASEVFSRMRSIQSIRQQSEWFDAICRADVALVPRLQDFLIGRNIPRAAIVVETAEATGRRPTYIPAFTVLDASDYEAASQLVGQRVELIGRIHEVKQSKTRRGRPYIFINFGPWQGKIVKITIWSEGLGNLSVIPDASWNGEWVSVTGLVDPPYHSRRYRYTHLSVTVTAQSQIQRISQKEALYRLAKDKGAPPKTNQDILHGLKSGKRRSKPLAVGGHTTVNKTANTAILEQLQRKMPTRTQPPSVPTYQQSGKQASGRCFVASAVFQDEESQFVSYLREYRDRVLASRNDGRLAIAVYGRLGPWIAKFVYLCPFARQLLRPLLAKIAVNLHHRMSRIDHRED